MDGKQNARDFIELVRPSLAVFVKYEFWYYYLAELKQKNIPAILISAAFREEQPFFQWYGGLFRKMLSCYTALFVQDERAKALLSSVNISKNVFVTGDTRYDRVANIAASVRPVPVVEQFKNNNQLLIAGSTWPKDEKVLKDCLNELPAGWKLIIAPHETDKAHIRVIQSLFGNSSVLYSEFAPAHSSYKILIIDNIGILASLYSYGEIAFVGGGFNKGGIHNILEPAVFGLPVIFGPVYQKFAEANTLVSLKLAFPVNNVAEAKATLYRLINDDNNRLQLQRSLKQYMQQSIGSTTTIAAYIKENTLL
jgi:3-deoxy-D-manno-octulosonic-acid transferase